MAHDEDKSRDIMVAPSGYNFYSDVSSSGNQNIIPTQFMTTHLPPPQQSFEPTTAAAEIYNLTAGMEMIGFPSKNSTAENPVFWKGFFSAKPGNNGGAGPSSSSSKEINDGADHFFHQNSIQQNHSDAMTHQNLWNIHQHQQNRFLDDDGDHDGDQSLSCSVFPCEGNERPSQGLSLSLSSSNPSTIGLQSFQLRQQHQHQSEVMHHQSHDVITNSKYLTPAQELLNEFCSLQTTEFDRNNSKMKAPKTSEWLDQNAIKTQPLYSLDLLELQRRKTKLLQMLEEVDRRYRHYCDQMKAVISSFETTAGKGAAGVYSSLASRAMSRHFRCLRDGIVSQIRATKKAMGDKDIAAPGTVKGETPRLRLLDQTIRQQRAIQQMSFMESHPWRPQRGLPERSVSVLRAWLFEHFLHPYPSDVDKHILARQTGLSRSQVSNWFINARVRLWKPMVEEMYLEELKEDEGGGGDSANLHENDGMQQISTTQNNHSRNEDLKPTHDQLVRIDSECLSSIINNNTNPDKNEAKRSKGAAGSLQNEHQHQIINPSFGETYGAAAMELDFSSYGHHSSGGGGGVSLTLGLHQNSLFYGRSDNIDDVQTAVSHQYSFLDSENQNLPYRNLMGAQLLRDLAG